LAKPEEIIHRGALIGLIEPQYPNASIRGGSASLPLAAMLRVHHLQQWDSLSDLAMEEGLIEVPTILWFAGLDLISDGIPDETTILTIHHLLERHELGEQLFKTVKDGLSARGITMLQSTIVDATVISAPCSIKNKERERGLKLNQTKNGNQWDFGM
jgi:IS5 family transposase